MAPGARAGSARRIRRRAGEEASRSRPATGRAGARRTATRPTFSTTDPEARLYRKDNSQGATLSYLGHDLIDTKSRVILRCRVSEATGTAERGMALGMLDEVLESREALGLPYRPEILTGDKNYGTGAFVTAVLDRDLLPHIPLLASAEPEGIPTWQRRTFDLGQMQARKQKVKQAEARNRVRELMQTRGYQSSRKLRVRSEHGFAEAKTVHGMGRARRRGRERVEQRAILTAVVQNLKRLASFLGRQGPGTPRSDALRSLSRLDSLIRGLIRPGRRLMGGRILVRLAPGRPITLAPSATAAFDPLISGFKSGRFSTAF